MIELEMLITTKNGCHCDFTWMGANEKHSFDSQMIDRPKTCVVIVIHSHTVYLPIIIGIFFTR